ncbi:hypothetical protein K3495_g1344 [Podosphaera aphanis]|nr:hypothetical protein K3495_g1344 [Podosphaera aphanis]
MVQRTYEGKVKGTARGELAGCAAAKYIQKGFTPILSLDVDETWTPGV